MHSVLVAFETPPGHAKPAGHGAGAVALSQKKPGWHGIDVFAAPPLHHFSAGQGAGTDVPLTQKKPMGQGLSHVWFSLLGDVPYVPAAHGSGPGAARGQ